MTKVPHKMVFDLSILSYSIQFVNKMHAKLDCKFLVEYINARTRTSMARWECAMHICNLDYFSVYFKCRLDEYIKWDLLSIWHDQSTRRAIQDFVQSILKQGIFEKGGLLKQYVTIKRKKCQSTKKAKTRKTQNGVDKNGKVQKLEKKLENLAQRIVTKEKYKNVEMLQRHKHGTHAPQPDSSVAVHYSFNAETWREILEILEILQG